MMEVNHETLAEGQFADPASSSGQILPGPPRYAVDVGSIGAQEPPSLMGLVNWASVLAGGYDSKLLTGVRAHQREEGSSKESDKVAPFVTLQANAEVSVEILKDLAERDIPRCI